MQKNTNLNPVYQMKQQRLDDEHREYHRKTDRYLMLFRLQIAGAVGCLFIVVYGFQFAGHGAGAGSILRIISVGMLTAGAALSLGFLLGFIFCIPRNSDTTKRNPESAVAPSDKEERSAEPVESNNNLIDISDWLTKILVGVGLVELSKIPRGMQKLAVFLAPGLGQCDSAHCTDSSRAFAIAIVIFFSGIGFLIGYLWTRLYYQRALTDLYNELKRSRRSALDAATADTTLTYGGTGLDDAMVTVDRALKEDSNNPAALMTKGRVLKRLAQVKSKPGDKQLLEEALTYATRAAELLPNKGGPKYNMACYQALLGFDRNIVLGNLREAFALNPTLKRDAQADDDLMSFWEDADFKELIKEDAPPSSV